MICYIPTKGRPNTKTYKLFQESGIEVFHFIEPQEMCLYEVPNKISIEKDNQGISYVRNFMLNYAKQNNEDWVIFCDDDVQAFGQYKENKSTKITSEIWIKILEQAKKLPFEMYGINYRQHALHERKEYSINNCTVEVCVNECQENKLAIQG